MRTSLARFALTALLTAGCTPLDIDFAAFEGSLGEVEGFDRVPDDVRGYNSGGDSIVRLRSEADDGSTVMTRLTLSGGIDRALADPEGADVRILGCSGPDGPYTYDRNADSARIRVEHTDDPAVRLVFFEGEFPNDGAAQRVHGHFEYRVVPEDVGGAVAD